MISWKKRLTWRWRFFCKIVNRLFAFHKCPVCEARVLRFRPLSSALLKSYDSYGRDWRRIKGETANILAYSCPDCETSDRARLYALFLREWMGNLLGGEKFVFLDFAPSQSLTMFIKRQIKRLNLNCEYITTDLFSDTVDVRADIQDLYQFGSDSVDFVLCSHVLEHVPDDRKAMCELYRILKTGGIGIVMVPIRLDLDEIDEDPSVTDVAERWRRFGQDDHVRDYCKNGFVQRLEDAGFRVSQLGWQHFGRKAFRRAGILERSVLYVVHK